MIKRTASFCFCLLAVACLNKKNSTPDGILPVQKMAKVMVDVNLLEASSNLYFDKKLVVESMEPASAIFKKHTITKKQYQESFNYYTRHLDSLDKIYQLVLIDLSKMQAEVMNKRDLKTPAPYPLVLSPVNPLAPAVLKKPYAVYNEKHQPAFWSGVVMTSGENE